MTKPNKSQLVLELEACLTPEDYNLFNVQNMSAFVFDVMNYVRKLPSSVATFKEFIKNFTNISSGIYENKGRCDYVFDIYDNDASVKDSEKQRRMTKPPVHLSIIKESTPFPKEAESFWSSNQNKLNLQKLIYKNISSHRSEYPITLGELEVSSEDWKCIKVNNNNITQMFQLQSNIKEADLRIPAHILDALIEGYTSVLVLCNDTDVIVELIHLIPIFKTYNLNELWVKAGIGDSTRHIPVHTLHHRLGNQLCAVLPALHCITGCDVTSKIGTKKAALKANPENYLMHFGTSPSLSNTVVHRAEQFLVKVLKPISPSSTFTAYRKEVFYSSKKATLQNLPPTSKGILSHIKRAFYNTYLIVHSLDKYLHQEAIQQPLPTDVGYEVYDNMYAPSASWNLLGEQWSIACNCSKCSRTSCACREKEVQCTKFCGCSIPLCKNPFS